MNEGVCEFLLARRSRRSREREGERKSRDLRVNKVRESRQEGTRDRDKVIGDRFRREEGEFVVPETVGTAFRGGRERSGLGGEGMNVFLPR